MQAEDNGIMVSETREVVAHFTNATRFEAAVDALAARRIPPEAINMMASHDAVREKLAHRFRLTEEPTEATLAPRRIYETHAEIAAEKALAIGVPVYIGAVGAGVAVVATGGTLAVAALIAAAGAAAGGGIGAMIARTIGHHHSAFLQQQLELGDLLIWVEVRDKIEEDLVLDILRGSGGTEVLAHNLTRHVAIDDHPINYRDPFSARPT